jgi:glycosyltransferase involved in cell wall biosynthesis
MRILMINHMRRYRSWHRSGAFARELVKRGHRVTLMVIADHERWRFRETDEDGVRVVECPDLAVGKLRSGWDPVCAWRRARWFSRSRQPYDIVHLFETRPATVLPGLWLARRDRLPVVIDWNDWWGRGGLIEINRPFWYRCLFGGFETFFEEHFRARADATTVISHGLADRAARLGVPRQTITHLRPGVDLARFSGAGDAEFRERLGFRAGDNVVGYSSQDTFFDIEPVLEGIRLARQSGFDLKLLVVGRHDRAFLRRLAAHDLLQATHVAGFVTDQDYPRYLAAADFMAVPFPRTPYNVGRWPNKFGDYLAAGRPIVFNPCGDLRDFAADPPGIACAWNGVEFADAFMALAVDRGLRRRLGARARELAQTMFRWDERIDALEAVYVRAIPAQSRGRPRYDWRDRPRGSGPFRQGSGDVVK